MPEEAAIYKRDPIQSNGISDALTLRSLQTANAVYRSMAQLSGLRLATPMLKRMEE